MNKTIERLIRAGMITVLAMVPLMHTAMAASLAPGDRHESGFDHGFAESRKTTILFRYPYSHIF